MARRSPQQKRGLGLWTASWLFVLLLAGLLRFGDLSVQWPVLLVPVLWALVALRPRRDGRGVPRDGRGVPRDGRGAEPEGWGPRRDDRGPRRDDRGPFEPPDDREPIDPWSSGPGQPGRRRPPATRELPWLPDVPRRSRDE